MGGKWLAIWILVAVALQGCRETPREMPGTPGTDKVQQERKEDKEVRNSLGMVLVLIPAGEFQMGAPDSETEPPVHTRPRHPVQITRPFRIAKHETTKAQFRQFVKETAYKTEAEQDGTGSWGYTGDKKLLLVQDPKFNWRETGFEQAEDHPVVNVTWSDAVEFCGWLSGKEGRVYRLPTEAEWEYACRAGTVTNWYAGDNEEILPRIANVADKTLSTNRSAFQYAKPWNDGFAFTAPVGQFPPNAFGLHDMHGNVWEWCNDWYQETYYSQSPSEDPRGPQTEHVFRVLRGGSWINLPKSSMSANRLWNMPTTRNATTGFRVVCDIPVSGKR